MTADDGIAFFDDAFDWWKVAVRGGVFFGRNTQWKRLNRPTAGWAA